MINASSKTKSHFMAGKMWSRLRAQSEGRGVPKNTATQGPSQEESCDGPWVAVFFGTPRPSDCARSLDHILPAMKWLFVLLLALIIFGGAAWFGYNSFVKEEIAVKKEQRGEVTPAP